MERLLANFKLPPCKKEKGSEKNLRRVESMKMKNTKEDFIRPGKRVLGG